MSYDVAGRSGTAWKANQTPVSTLDDYADPDKRSGMIQDCAEKIAEDVIKAFDAWIRPELAKIIGWPAVEKIKDQDFDSVLQTQARMLYLKRSHTVRKDGATYYFKLCQGSQAKPLVLAKFQYEVIFDDYTNPHESYPSHE
jgi:hypothetical protein